MTRNTDTNKAGNPAGPLPKRKSHTLTLNVYTATERKPVGGLFYEVTKYVAGLQDGRDIAWMQGMGMNLADKFDPIKSEPCDSPEWAVQQVIRQLFAKYPLAALPE